MAYNSKYSSGGDSSEPLNYTQIIYEQIRTCAKLKHESPAGYYSAVMELKTLLTPYIKTDRAKVSIRIKDIISKRTEELEKIANEKEKKDLGYMTHWNNNTASLLLGEFMMLMQRCGFLPQRTIDWVIEDDETEDHEEGDVDNGKKKSD